MDPEDSENKDSRRLRSGKAFAYEATPRSPLKRSRRDGGSITAATTATATVNGSKHVEDESDDGENPKKRIRLNTEGTDGCDNDSNETVVQDSEKKEDAEEMDIEQDSSHATSHLKTSSDFQQNEASKNEDTEVMDVEQDSSHASCQLKTSSDFHQNEASKNEDRDLYPHVMLVRPSTKPPASLASSVSHLREQENTHKMQMSQVTSVAQRRRNIVMPAKSTGSFIINHGQMRQRGNNIVTQKEGVKPKKEAMRMKTSVTKTHSGDSSKGCALYVCFFLLLVLLSCIVLLSYKITPLYQRTGTGAEYPSRSVSLEKFADLLSQLETRFAGQRPDLWERSKVHLERHLKTAQPKEPVSLILTAGRKAERTLHCLAKSLASAFSSALNASVLQLDGASKAGLGSDEVKLDIDRQLRAAFEHDKPVAVIHRLEELPPGSTIIFYRYCDHENAAYKRVFLLFTVLLSHDEVTGNLKEVEEIVQDYLKEKLIGSSNQMTFNEMDTDKYSGLWSRISHLVLPVVSVGEVEQKGCL